MTVYPTVWMNQMKLKTAIASKSKSLLAGRVQHFITNYKTVFKVKNHPLYNKDSTDIRGFGNSKKSIVIFKLPSK